MRARVLLSILLLAAVVAACERGEVTGPQAPGAAPRSTQTTGGAAGEASSSQGGYLGSGNRNDSTSTEPISPSTTQP